MFNTKCLKNVKTIMIGLSVVVQVVASANANGAKTRKRYSISLGPDDGPQLLQKGDVYGKARDMTNDVMQILREQIDGSCAAHTGNALPKKDANKLGFCVCGAEWVIEHGSLNVEYESDTEKLKSGFILVNKIIEGIDGQYNNIINKINNKSKYSDPDIIRLCKLFQFYIKKNGAQLTIFFNVLKADAAKEEKPKKTKIRKFFSKVKGILTIGLKVVRIVAAIMEFNVAGAFEGLSEMAEFFDDAKEQAIAMKEIAVQCGNAMKRMSEKDKKKIEKNMKDMMAKIGGNIKELATHKKEMIDHLVIHQIEDVQLSVNLSTAIDTLRIFDKKLNFRNDIDTVLQETKFRQDMYKKIQNNKDGVDTHKGEIEMIVDFLKQSSLSAEFEAFMKTHTAKNDLRSTFKRQHSGMIDMGLRRRLSPIERLNREILN